jgi:diguanylate cyclase (GGDEF)-like protein
VRHANPSVRFYAPWARYLFAIVLAALAIYLSRMLLLGGQGAYAVSLALVAVTAWRCGRGPSLAALAITGLGGLLAFPPTQPGALFGALLASASFAFIALLVSQLVTGHRHEALRLAQLAFYDPLTRLPNRSLFMDRLTLATERSLRHNRRLALLFLDFDDFKLVNDRFGHQAGDALLATVGDRLRNVVRASDTVARLGGDEFAVLLEDVKDASSARLVAQRLIDVLNYPIIFQGQSLHCSPSVGIAYAIGGSPLPQELLRQADTALYQAKRDNKGWYCEAPARIAGL